MWPALSKGVGTFYFQDFPNFLDQFMISKGIALGRKFQVEENSTAIVTYPGMLKGQYKIPIKFGRPSDHSLNEDGFSDHLPISVLLKLFLSPGSLAKVNQMLYSLQQHRKELNNYKNPNIIYNINL